MSGEKSTRCRFPSLFFVAALLLLLEKMGVEKKSGKEKMLACLHLCYENLNAQAEGTNDISKKKGGLY